MTAACGAAGACRKLYQQEKMRLQTSLLLKGQQQPLPQQSQQFLQQQASLQQQQLQGQQQQQQQLDLGPPSAQQQGLMQQRYSLSASAAAVSQTAVEVSALRGVPALHIGCCSNPLVSSQWCTRNRGTLHARHDSAAHAVLV
jgi:hypothetical protein